MIEANNFGLTSLSPYAQSLYREFLTYFIDKDIKGITLEVISLSEKSEIVESKKMYSVFAEGVANDILYPHDEHNYSDFYYFKNEFLNLKGLNTSGSNQGIISINIADNGSISFEYSIIETLKDTFLKKKYRKPEERPEPLLQSDHELNRTRERKQIRLSPEFKKYAETLAEDQNLDFSAFVEKAIRAYANILEN
jgi:hypothetical protein